MAHKFGERIDRLLTGVEIEPTAADLLAELKRKLRDLELAQLSAAQTQKVVLAFGVKREGSNMGKLMDQVLAARRAQGVK